MSTRGTELWDFSLVDPDNRRAVDFRKRTQLLKDLKKRESKSRDTLIPELLFNWEDGRIKLYVTYKALNFRRENRDLFLEGEYLPLFSSGARRNNVVAFSRSRADKWVLVAVPRLVAKVAAPGPLGKRAWGESVLNIPPEAPRSWTNIFTGISWKRRIPLKRGACLLTGFSLVSPSRSLKQLNLEGVNFRVSGFPRINRAKYHGSIDKTGVLC